MRMEETFMKSFAWLGLLLLFYPVVNAQEISLSSELNIRNYFSYELLGEVEDRYLVLRDKGFTKEVDVFNEYLEHTVTAELNLEQKRADIIHSMGLDSVFQIIYSYVERDSLYLRMRRYDSKVQLIDSSLLRVLDKSVVKKRFNAKLSEDKDRILIHSLTKDDQLLLMVFDNHSAELSWNNGLIIKDFEPAKDKYEMLLTDDGQLLLSIQPKWNFKRKEVSNFKLLVYDFKTAATQISNIDMDGVVRRDLFMDYDNLNKKVIVMGTYSEKHGKEPLGYYLVHKRFDELADAEEPEYLNFSKQLMEKVGRSKKKKNKVFQNFWIRDILKRQDGGLIVMMELYKEFSRRSSYSPGTGRSDFNTAARRGWVDYYNEDVIVSSFNPDHELDWTKILYKKQFSQDDEAVFSSYFVMKTPSRLRLVYNDEIKKSSTVSEYIMDPTGRIKRNSLLSTSNQELKLRFRDAVQLSNNELLVPSESSYSLSLVKITY